MSDRATMRAEVERRLGRRQLVWAGIRGSDIEPLRDVAALSASFTIVDAYTGRPDVMGVGYERLTGVRVDPEVWDIDDHHADPATAEFRRGLLRALAAESALLPYRPSSFLSAIHFARRDRCLNLGLFGAHQSAFEHKPFVESAVAELGLPQIPWIYIADEEQLDVLELAEHGPLILRRSRTSGGEGFTHVDGIDDVISHWPKLDEAFVSVATFIEGGTPVNVGATVWPNAPREDCVTVHHPSVQLIGIPSCVTREFGYSGNDFGLVRDMERSTVNQIEESAKRIGSWLRGNGYIGTFGVDFLVKDGVPLFTEINPRFQGSTAASCRLSIEANEACLMLEHMAAWLGVAMPASPPLWDRVQETRDLANVVVHWTGTEPRLVDAPGLARRLRAAEPSTLDAEVLVPRGVISNPGSLVGRFTIGRRVTKTGYDLTGDLDQVVSEWTNDQERTA